MKDLLSWITKNEIEFVGIDEIPEIPPNELEALRAQLSIKGLSPFYIKTYSS
jgi:hypothetical protein